ncbi:MAG TPA: hypothetical protein DCY42_09580 [Chloroflexi bacterium]|nr:hypothetical protein [Chloroflexota bacterium]
MSEMYDFTELFSQYAVEVGRYLPRRKRKDIQIEILSLLQDSMDDKSAASGQQPDEAMAIEVLKEFGPPITFAENYHQDNTLIGPAIFPLFKPALFFTMALFILQFIVGSILPGGEPGNNFLTVVDTFFDKAFQVFGILVFAFALLERTTPAEWLRWPFKEMERTWDPSGLKPDKRKQAIKPGELWADAVFLAGMIILLSVFPQWVGFGINRNGVWSFVPVLSEAFNVYLPWVVAYFLTKLAFEVALAGQSFWDTRMRWIAVGVKVFGLLLLFALWAGPDVFGLNPAYLAQHTPLSSSVAWFESTQDTWNTFFNWYLIISMIVQSFLLLRLVLQAFTGKEQLKLDLK